MTLASLLQDTIGTTRSRSVARDVAITVLCFTLASIWGGIYWAGAVRAGRHPLFYQSYFAPAVMLVCGKGFLIPTSPVPSLNEFLLEKTDRFSCDQLPPRLAVGTAGLYQRPWRYLMTTVAVAWMVLGISWSGLAPLFGVFFGTTAALTYVAFRLIVGRTAAAVGAAALSVSTLQLTNLLNLRDYAKTPFTLALVLILVALAVRPWRPRAVLLCSLAYGLVMGVGYGFRTDLLIDIPPLFVTIALFLPGGPLRSLPVKIAGLALFTAGFAAAGWPIITSVVQGGGCQWHVFLLGLTTPFNDTLRVGGGAYNWGQLYNDDYIWTTVSSYASRFRPDLGYIEYCSHDYDVVSWQYLRHILTTFPADMLTRVYAAVLRVLDLPFQVIDPPFTGHAVLVYQARARILGALQQSGPFLAAAFVLVLGWSSLRLALFAVFITMYFGGYPAIQFGARHYFHFEFITWAILAFLVERAVHLSVALVRKVRTAEPKRTRGPWPIRNIRRIAVCGALVATLLLVPLAALRRYQNGRVTRLLQSYVTSPAVPLVLQRVAPGQYRVSGESAESGIGPTSPTGPGHPETLFVKATFDAASCRPGTAVTFRYDPGHPETDFSDTVSLGAAAGRTGTTHVFEAVHTDFVGLDVTDDAPGCLQDVAALTHLDRFPLLLSAQLSPGWETQAQYQRIRFGFADHQ